LGSSGHLAWAALTVWQVELLKVEGLPPTQPVLPWLGVISASVCQIVVAWMRRTGTPIPQRLMVMTWILSIYDLATTFNGTSAVAWIARYGLLVQVPASLVITFTFEVAVGVLLAIVSNAARRE
jgi:hypothetical protein